MDKGWQHLEVELGKAEQIRVSGRYMFWKEKKKKGGGAYVKFSN